MNGICNRHEKITGYRKGPQPGTIDFKVELILLLPPIPEKLQRKARFRRLRQQLYRCEITAREYLDSLARVRKDYQKGYSSRDPYESDL